MEITNNYSSQNFGNLKFAKNVANTTKKAVYINPEIKKAAKEFNIKVSSFQKDGLDKTKFVVAKKGQNIFSKIKGSIETYTAYIKNMKMSDFTDSITKAEQDKVAAKKLAIELKKLAKDFNK